MIKVRVRVRARVRARVRVRTRSHLVTTALLAGITWPARVTPLASQVRVQQAFAGPK